MSLDHQLLLGDSFQVLPTLASNSVESVITDPPYFLNFMDLEFDRVEASSREMDGPAMQAWHLRWLKECLRIIKPGGMLLAFGATRTFHRLFCAAEDAGFVTRDTLVWTHAQGCPKSRDLGRDLESFAGFGTALKPAMELILLAMKPLEGTFAENALKWGVAGLNIDAARVPVDGGLPVAQYHGEQLGRWPANLIIDGSCQVTALFPGSAGGGDDRLAGYGDTGSAARFYFCAKPSRRERYFGGMAQPVKLRGDLTPEQREMVLAELRKAGVVL